MGILSTDVDILDEAGKKTGTKAPLLATMALDPLGWASTERLFKVVSMDSVTAPGRTLHATAVEKLLQPEQLTKIMATKHGIRLLSDVLPCAIFNSVVGHSQERTKPGRSWE